MHTALMPDYNTRATTYWWCVVAAGTVTFLYAVSEVASAPSAVWLQVLVGMLIAMLAGVFPVRIRQSRNSFAAGEVFIFLLLLMHGPAAATLAAAGEAAVGAFRTSGRWTSRIVSPAMAALAMFGAGSLLDAAVSQLTRLEIASEIGRAHV